MLMPATVATAERANSPLKFVKNDFCSTMTEDRLNGPILFYIHKNIILEYEIITNDFAN